MDEFTCWLEKRKEDLRVKACCAAPDEFKDWEVEWNWEVSSLVLSSYQVLVLIFFNFVYSCLSSLKMNLEDIFQFILLC